MPVKGRKKMKKIYLAYGSNLNKNQMAMRCPGAKVIGTAYIEGYQLLFKGSRTGSFLTIEEQDGGKVPVGVWEVSERDELSLDFYEGYPTFYYKKPVKVTLNETGKEINAFVYIMHEERKLGIPSQFYINVCMQGYMDFGFDFEYIKKAIEITKGGMKND